MLYNDGSSSNGSFSTGGYLGQSTAGISGGGVGDSSTEKELGRVRWMLKSIFSRMLKGCSFLLLVFLFAFSVLNDFLC